MFWVDFGTKCGVVFRVLYVFLVDFGTKCGKPLARYALSAQAGRSARYEIVIVCDFLLASYPPGSEIGF